MSVTVTYVGPITNGSSYLAGADTPDYTAKEFQCDFNLTLSGTYGSGSSNGDAVSFAGLQLNFSLGSYAPSDWNIHELIPAGTAGLGYQYEYHPGPTLAAPTQNGGVLYISGTGAGSGQGGTQITQGSAYSGFTPSLDGAVLRVRFKFIRL